MKDKVPSSYAGARRSAQPLGRKMAHEPETSESSKPSPRSILMLAGLAGACWLIAALALIVTVGCFLDRNGGHGMVFLAFGAFAVITLIAAGIAVALGLAAQSRLRRRLSPAEDAA